METTNETIKNVIKEIYKKTLSLDKGSVADYIPQLAQVNPHLYGISVCFQDGETFGIGDHKQYFCLQSCSKPLNYCISRQQYENANPDSNHDTPSIDVSNNKDCLIIQ